MKTQNKEIRTGKTLKVILGFAIGIALGFGFTKLVKSVSQPTAFIESTIQQDAHLESVDTPISNAGILQEAKRINDSLKVAFENYDEEAILFIRSNATGKIGHYNIRKENIL